MDVNVGKKFKIREVEYEVVASLDERGQGKAWKMRSLMDGKAYVLKILEPVDAERVALERRQLQALIRSSERLSETVQNAGVTLALPKEYGTTPTGRAYYLMEFVKGETLDALWENGMLSGLSARDKLKLARKLSLALAALHSANFCHTNLNWSSFMWDAESDVLSVVNCDDIFSCADVQKGAYFLYGTGFFIAPEVAFGREEIKYVANRYSLAVLLFRLLTNNVLWSPYHGEATFSSQPPCLNMRELAERAHNGEMNENWRYYVFDPEHRENGVEHLYEHSDNLAEQAFRKQLEGGLAAWSQVDELLKEKFLKTFRDPFAVENRLSAGQWVGALDALLAKPVKAELSPSPEPKESLSEPEQKTRLAQPTAYLIDGYGRRLPLGEETTIGGEGLGMSSKPIGILRRAAVGYEFESRTLCVVKLRNSYDKELASLRKGEKARLLSGDKICPVVSKAFFTLKY